MCCSRFIKNERSHVFHLLDDGPGQASPVVVVSSFAGQLCPAISHTKQTKKRNKSLSHYYYHSLFLFFFCRWQQIWPGDKLSFQLLLSVRRSFFIKPKGGKKIKTFILGVLFVTFWCAGREWKWLVGWQLERRLSDPALLPSTRRRADPVYYTSDSPIIATAPIKKKKLHFRIAVSHLFLTQKGKSILQELIFFSAGRMDGGDMTTLSLSYNLSICNFI